MSSFRKIQSPVSLLYHFNKTHIEGNRTNLSKLPYMDSHCKSKSSKEIVSIHNLLPCILPVLLNLSWIFHIISSGFYLNVFYNTQWASLFCPHTEIEHGFIVYIAIYLLCLYTGDTACMTATCAQCLTKSFHQGCCHMCITY